MNKYGISLKSRDSVTVYYDKEVSDLLELISKNDFVSLNTVGTLTWSCGDVGDVKMQAVVIRCSEIESIYYMAQEQNA